jgi:hypothetical protein
MRVVLELSRCANEARGTRRTYVYRTHLEICENGHTYEGGQCATTSTLLSRYSHFYEAPLQELTASSSGQQSPLVTAGIPVS